MQQQSIMIRIKKTPPPAAAGIRISKGIPSFVAFPICKL
jgi:hypothetical protein